ncbi:diguanylate cyclase [Angustibacter sp. McL0619]|uniref:tetratricopeptide repeat-containing diguanylate cyclase n=1 Tax=Angustibacter sp. McL0619 TaxID=3415676 RepID=UPI003CECA0A4
MSAAKVNHGGTMVLRPQFGPYMSIVFAAHAKYLDGDSEGALRDAGAAMLLVKGAGDHLSERFLEYTLCSALREQGRHEEVVDRATELLDRIGDDDPVWRAKALAVQAHALASLSRIAQAMDAVSEAEHLLAQHGSGTYNHLSATLALAIALQPLRGFELALSQLNAILPLYPGYGTYIAGEMSLVEAHWAATLDLAALHDEATGHYRACQSYALRTRQAAQDEEDPEFGQLRADVYEAFVLARLGEHERARAMLLPIPDDDLRADYPEHDLAYITIGRIAMAQGFPDRARKHFQRVVHTAERTGRDLWRSVALHALAEVEEAVHGEHPAHAWWRSQVVSLHQQAVHEADTRARELRERALVRQLRETSDAMSRAALLDPLTGLANRRALTEFMLDDGSERGAVFVDVDYFKEVNDRFSHEVGDTVLQRVAELLTASCRGDDLVVRYGGDEFLLICPGGAAGANAVAYRAHAAVRREDWTAVAADLMVTVSVGVAVSAVGREALRMADAALYRAKSAGRDQVAEAA